MPYDSYDSTSIINGNMHTLTLAIPIVQDGGTVCLQTIAGGELSEGSKSSSIVSDGSYDGSSYDTSDKVKFELAETSGVYKIHAYGDVTVNRAIVTKQVTRSGYFTVDSEPQTAISSDSLTVNNPDTPYYIKKSILSNDSVIPSTSAQFVTIGEGYYPSNRVVTIAAMDSGSVVVSGTNVVNLLASISGTNIELSNTDNGISVISTGSGTASASAAAISTAAGYIPNKATLDTQIIAAASQTTTESSYVSGVIIPIPSTGTNNFSVTVPDGDNSTLTLTFKVSLDGSWVIE